MDGSPLDCIIVGARCAGVPLAMHLQRAGMRVVVLEQKALFTDQPFSTHVVQAPGLALLDELGVGDRVRAAAPEIKGARMQVLDGAFDLALPEDLRMRCPRRSTLDPILQRAALEAGVEIHERTRVTELLYEGDRVVGVKAERAQVPVTYRARFVVGADGRNSTIARLVGAKGYIEHGCERAGFWAYWEKPACWGRDEPYTKFQTVISIEETARFVFECDGDLLIMGALVPIEEARACGKDHLSFLRRALRASELTAPLAQADPVSKPTGMLKVRFFFREPVGRGWALVGDAGLHKDPTPGHGITDALRDAKALARALIDGRPEALELYWRARDVASVPLYYQGLSMGRLSFATRFNRLVMKRMNEADGAQLERMHGILRRERSPFDMATPSAVVRWVLSAVLRGDFGVLPGFWASSRFATEVERELSLRTQLLREAQRNAPSRQDGG